MAAQRDRVAAVGEHLPEFSGKSVSIIIPVYNEASQLDGSLKKLFDGLESSEIEVILSDGGSTDNTLLIAKQYPCKILSSEIGRARQMNTASRHANGEFLLFLHADSSLPDDWLKQVQASQNWGFFPVKLSGRHWLLRIIETAINLRSRASKVATGDQGLYFRKSFFNDLKGFPDIPIMEDVAISKRAREFSKPCIGLNPIITSSRRWEQNGIVKTVFLMWGLRFAFWLGISPHRLHRIYY
jgi:rSAM/selenodomain-associated transferase 2